MKIIGDTLCSKAESGKQGLNPRPSEFQTIAMSIMDASTEKDIGFEEKMDRLALEESPNQRSMAAKLIRYKSLPLSANSEELPDDFDLMDKDLALDTLVSMGKRYERGTMDIFLAADRIMGMSPEEQKAVAERGLEENGMNYDHLVPLGLEVI